MASVTQRIKKIKQPYGGYLPPKWFSKTFLNDDMILSDGENISADLVATAVDYLTRFMLGSDVREAFHVSILGAIRNKMLEKALDLISIISGLDDNSIIAACKLVGFDVCYRASISKYEPIEKIFPNKITIENIRIMVKRSCCFFEQYGPVTHVSPVFTGGYTKTVNAGDGDFTTRDTLWDFKILRAQITSNYTLQILMYYIMGLHSKYAYFKEITKLGFYNPRLNIVYTIPVSAIPDTTIKEIEKSVICYD